MRQFENYEKLSPTLMGAASVCVFAFLSFLLLAHAYSQRVNIPSYFFSPAFTPIVGIAAIVRRRRPRRHRTYFKSFVLTNVF